MEVISQFFTGLEGPASLTFLGLLTLAFLIGLLPAGLTYAFRIRDLQKRLKKAGELAETRVGETSSLASELKEERGRTETLLKRTYDLEQANEEYVSQLEDITVELESARREVSKTRALLHEQQAQLQSLRGQAQIRNEQLQSLRATQRPIYQRAQEQLQPRDEDLRANLKWTKDKVRQLEARCRELTQDNEQLRRRITR